MTEHLGCPGCSWKGYEHVHDDAEDGPREECCEHNHKEDTMAKYLRLTIDVRVENDEFARDLLDQEATAFDLHLNVEAGEVSIDGYSDVEDHGSAS